MVTTVVVVAVVAVLLGAILGWLERGRRCRAAHAHLVARYDQGDLDGFLDGFLGGDPDPVAEAALEPAPEPAAPPVGASEQNGRGEVRPGTFPGSALPGPGGSAPAPGYVVKAKLRSRIYHTPTSPSYSKTVPEVWFRCPEDAEAAGFRAPRQQGRGAPQG